MRAAAAAERRSARRVSFSTKASWRASIRARPAASGTAALTLSMVWAVAPAELETVSLDLTSSGSEPTIFSMKSCRFSRSEATLPRSLRYLDTRLSELATLASRSSSASRSRVAVYWLIAIAAMLTIHASSKAAASPAAISCNRDEILMKRTWPWDRMKNSRSGNQLRRRSLKPPSARFCKATPKSFILYCRPASRKHEG